MGHTLTEKIRARKKLDPNPSCTIDHGRHVGGMQLRLTSS